MKVTSMILRMMIHSIMILNFMTLSIATLVITTFSIMILSLTLACKITLDIMTFGITKLINPHHAVCRAY